MNQEQKSKKCIVDNTDIQEYHHVSVVVFHDFRAFWREMVPHQKTPHEKCQVDNCHDHCPGPGALSTPGEKAVCRNTEQCEECVHQGILVCMSGLTARNIADPQICSEGITAEKE